MGARHSLEDDLITFRLTKKQMERSARKCEQNQQVQREKLKDAMKKGNMEGAKIYAENVIREKNQGLNFLRLGSRIDAVASRIETALRMQAVSQAMGQTVKSMSSAMKSMDSEKMAHTMDLFEKQFQDLDVQSNFMEKTMATTTAMATPPDQVDNLMRLAADEAGLQYSELMDGVVPSGNLTQPAAAATNPAEMDLEARLAALRK
eukprot:gene3665-7304_t